MATALDIFRLIIRDEIGPSLRRMGFKGSGQSFRPDFCAPLFERTAYSRTR
jgi:hypothetical protein